MARVNRLLRFSTTLTRRQARPRALLLQYPPAFQSETIQSEVSNGEGLRPWANNRVFPTDPEPEPVIKPPALVGTLGPWTVTQNTAVQTFNAAIGFQSDTALTYSLVTPIPTGITINASTGVVSADTVATGLGTKVASVKATNAGGFAVQPFSVIITNPIVPPSLVGVLADWNVVGNTGNQTYNASTGFTGASLVYSLTTGATGVSINSATGVVTAASTTVTVGLHALVIRATNGAGFVEQTLNLYATAAVVAPTLVGTLAATTMPQNTGTKTYPTAGGFAGASIVYSLVSPPQGISINSATGIISVNTATAPVAAHSLTVRATNSAGFVNQPLSLTVYVAPAKVGTLAAWTEVQATGAKTYAAAAGFSGSFLVYSLATGATGVSINSSTGVVTVDTAVAVVGAVSLVIRATNGAGFVDQNLSLTLTAALQPPALVGTLAAWAIQQNTGNQTYNAATGFSGSSIVYSLATGATGVSINSATGLITADTTVVTTGVKSLVVMATNGAGFVNQPLSLTVSALAAPATVGSITAKVETAGTGPTTYATAANFSGQGITYSFNPIAPAGAGLTIDATTGIITATLAAAFATATISVRATNGAGFATQTFSFTVNAAVPPKAQQLIDTDFNMIGTTYDPAYPAPSTSQTGVIEIPVTSAAFDSTSIWWGALADVPMPTVYIGLTTGGAKLYRCNSSTGQHMKAPLDFYGGIYVYHKTDTTSLSDPSDATCRFTVPGTADKTIASFKPL